MGPESEKAHKGGSLTEKKIGGVDLAAAGKDVYNNRKR